MIVQFPPFRLDLASGELTKDGRAVKLHPQPAQLLVLLAGRPGENVTRDEIKKALWEDETHVDFDLGINSCIRQIRNALEDHADEPRYLETVPRKGYRFIATFQEPTVEPEPPSEPPRLKPSKLWMGIPVVLAAVVALALLLSKSKTVEPPPTSVTFTKYDGLEREPAFSPDGEQLAFVWNGKAGRRNGEADRRYHLYVKMIGGDEPLQLTNAPHNDYSPAWSPDGREIAFLRTIRVPERQSVSEVRVVPALGGNETLLGTVATARESGWPFDPGLSWSPDGRFVVTVDKEFPDEQEGVFLISTQTGEKQRLTTPPQDTLMRDRQPVFSPDGRSVAFIRGRGLHRFQIHVQSMDGGEPKLLRDAKGTIRDIDWVADGSSLVFSYFSERPRLWEISKRGGTPKLLPVGEGATFISIARTRNLLAYSNNLPPPNDILRVHGPSSQESEAATTLISSASWDYWPSYSPDGARIAFVSHRSGGNAIWVCESNGSNCTQMTDAPAYQPWWSPDGEKIAFHGQRGDNEDVFVVDVDGKFTRRLTHDEAVDRHPSWSRDGQWIYFSSSRNGKHQIWKIPSDGGESIQVTRKGGESAQESEDGFLYFAVRRQPASYKWIDIWKTPVDGGEETPVLEGELVEDGNWVLWNHNVVFRRRLRIGGPCVIDMMDLDTSEVRLIADLGPELRYNFGISISPDGQFMLFSKLRPPYSDITLVENFR